MSEITDPTKMTIGDQLLVDKLADGQASLGDLGKVLALTYTQTDAQTKVLSDHGDQLKELKKQVEEHLTPSVTLLLGSQSKAKAISRGVGTLITFLGVGALSWLWSTGIASKEKIAYLSNLNDTHVADVAAAKIVEHDKVWEEKVDQKFISQTREITSEIIKNRTDIEAEINAKRQ